MRCVATKHGLFTRKGERYLTCKHIEDALKPFFKDYPDAVLDGELFNEKYRQQLNEISKLIRKTVHITQDDLDKCAALVRYYVYDGYDFDTKHGPAIPYTYRKAYIDSHLPDDDCLMTVPSQPIKKQDDLDETFSFYVDAGHEGVMLRNCYAPYENKRSKHLLKVKPEDDDEAVIIDINEGVGNWAGTGKIITLKWNGETFNATFKGSKEQAVQFLKDKKKWVGKTVTFLYNGLTGLGIPNFARVDINNCIKGDR